MVITPCIIVSVLDFKARPASSKCCSAASSIRSMIQGISSHAERSGLGYETELLRGVLEVGSSSDISLSVRPSSVSLHSALRIGGASSGNTAKNLAGALNKF